MSFPMNLEVSDGGELLAVKVYEAGEWKRFIPESKLGDSETIRRSLANDLNTQAETITALESRLGREEVEHEATKFRVKALQESLDAGLQKYQTALGRLSWRPIREGRPTEPGFYAMIYMPSGPFHRDIISSKVATFAEISDTNHFHDEWQWLGPLPITSFLVEKP